MDTAPRTSNTAEAIVADPRWRALVARDREADGRFYYAVRTTGVYCRPGCPSRLPRPENVSFHVTPEDAERAGFRPCARCRPQAPTLAQRHADLVATLCRYIEAADDPPTLEALARQAQLSPHHLHRIFRAVTGLTPRAYAIACRDERLRGALGRGAPVTRAIHDAGYGSTARLYERSREVLGMTPTEYRRGGAGVEILHSTGACALGAVLVAQTAQGVCAILLGDEPAALLADLGARFPRARLQPGGGAQQHALDAALRMLETPALGLGLPLDLRGTAFQRRVWQALREIPAGTTTNYTELARRLGVPRAVRAVASACAANPLAVAVPCHRVLRSDGSLAGYRWGLERKRALLDREVDQRIE